MAREQVKIEYSSDDGPFEVILTSLATDFFARAKAMPDIANKQGEELVSALLARAKGGPFKIERYKNGNRNNGPNGEPAVEEFTEDGMAVSLFENGKFHDGPNGEPAYQRMNNDSQVVHTAYYQHGQRNDGKHGEPAEQISDGRGTFIYVASYKDDKLMKMFTAPELAEFQARNAPAPAAPARKKAKTPGM